MKKNNLLLFAAIVFFIPGFAQKDSVLNALKKYSIDTSILNPNIASNSLSYAYELKREVNTEGNYKVYISGYNPALTGLERWMLRSVNGKRPSNSELKAFNKEHEYTPAYKIDDASLTVTKDDGRTLMIRYKYIPASIDEDHSFLKDCVFISVINISTGRLESTTQKNLKDVKIKIVKAIKLEGTTHYIYDEQNKKYLISTAEVVAVIKLLGRQVSMVTNDSYTYHL